jgi:hypothetical protein
LVIWIMQMKRERWICWSWFLLLSFFNVAAASKMMNLSFDIFFSVCLVFYFMFLPRWIIYASTIA